MIIRRVYALYRRNKAIAALLASYLTAELGVALWVYLASSTERKFISDRAFLCTQENSAAAMLSGPPEVFNIPVLHRKYCI